MSTKRCHVCGDVALSFNFNGLSCDSCKSFFRRNAHKQNESKCHREGNCEMTRVTRRYCQGCRLEKCFAVGMKKEFINMKLSKRKTKHSNIHSLVKVLTGNCSKLVQNSRTSVSSMFDKKLNLCEAYSRHCMAIIKKHQIVLQENCLDKGQFCPKIIGYARDVHFAFNTQEFMINVMMNFSQCINEFQSLKLEDRLTIFKSTFPEMMMLRSLTCFHFQRDAFVCRLDEAAEEGVFVTLNMLYGEGKSHLVEIHRKLAHLMYEHRCDNVLRDLMSALILFNPRNPTTTCPEYMRYQYTRYSHLLEHYLVHKYANQLTHVNQATEKSKKTYFEMFEILDCLSLLKANVLQYYSCEQNVNSISSYALSEIYEIEQ